VVTTTQFAGVSQRFRFPGASGHTPRVEDKLWALLAALVLLFGLLATNRKVPNVLPQGVCLTIVVLGTLLVGLSAMSCQGSSNTAVAGSAAVTGTPSGNYVITITGTLGSNAKVTRSTTVNLTLGPG
jgi:hypothetical protein